MQVYLLFFQNVYIHTVYYLLSVLVINDEGCAVPVLQAISAVDLQQTSNYVMETLLSAMPGGADQRSRSQPAAAAALSLFMSDDYCYTPFIQAIANVFRPEVLTTLPLQVRLLIFSFFPEFVFHGKRENTIALPGTGNVKQKSGLFLLK